MIADDQNSRVHGGRELVAEQAAFGCAGCVFDLFGQCTQAMDGVNARACQPWGRKDERAIIWVDREPTEGPATVATDVPNRAFYQAACADKLDAFSIVFDDPAYASLGRILTRAYAQAATGKGAERHAQGQPFERQPMQDLIRLHGAGFATGQAGKKSQEALRLPRERAVTELLGAIVYLAGAVIAIEAGDTHHKD